MNDKGEVKNVTVMHEHIAITLSRVNAFLLPDPFKMGISSQTAIPQLWNLHLNRILISMHVESCYVEHNV
jgi:hypothetical protein